MDEFFNATSQLVKSFWAGKVLQGLDLTEDDLDIASKDAAEGATLDLPPRPSPHDSLTSDALCCLATCETSLSARVHSVVTGEETETPSSGAMVHSDDRAVICSDGTLNWTQLTEYLEGVEGTGDLSGGAVKCSLLAEQVHQKWCLERKEISASMRAASSFAWTPQPEVFWKCLAVLEDTLSSEVQVYATILLTTAALERALGDVFLSKKKGQCPHLLRDLLATKELEEVFSPTAMYLLRCLMGPPTGINLRNIVWHGFAHHKEIPSKFATMLLVVAASLGRLLSSQSHLTIAHRAFVTFPQQEADLSTVLRDITPNSCQILKRLFSYSFFILPTMLPIWEAAIEAFSNGDYSVCLCLLLPSLEHGLRRVFACVNKCPERAVTAEADSLYTTFDEILSPVLPNGEPNLLPGEIGTVKMEMLLDLLVHPEGLRLRDRVSHGEVEFCTISRCLANHVLCMAGLFCAHYSLTKQVLENVFLMECLATESRYVPLFHPLSLLKKEMENLMQELDATTRIPSPWTTKPFLDPPCIPAPRTAEPLNSPTPQKPAVPLNQRLYCTILDKVGHAPPPHPPWQRDKTQQLLTNVWSTLNTLFLARQQLELVSTMRRVVSNITTALHQVRGTAVTRYSQHEKQELRSRQRTNYKMLVSSFPLYQECTEAIVLFLSLSIAVLQSPQSTHFNNPIKFHKKLLQFSENFSSQTSPTRNRWEEANKLCNSTIDSLEQQMAHFKTDTTQCTAADIQIPIS